MPSATMQSTGWSRSRVCSRISEVRVLGDFAADDKTILIAIARQATMGYAYNMQSVLASSSPILARLPSIGRDENIFPVAVVGDYRPRACH